MNELPKWLRSLIILVFIIGFFPFFAELLTIKAVGSQSLISIWSVSALAFLIIMTEVDIYTIASPPRISESKTTQRSIDWIQQKTTIDLRKIWATLVSLKNTIVTFIDPERIRRFKILLISLGYIGMFISALIPGFGRIGNGMYARGKKQFPFGRVVLYLGCLARFLSVYGGVHILLF